MTTSRLPVLATAFGACMLLMLSFLLCVALWWATANPVWYVFPPYLLLDFPQVSLVGIIHGLIRTGLIGIYAGGVFAAFFNLWNWAVRRLPGRARAGRPSKS